VGVRENDGIEPGGLVQELLILDPRFAAASLEEPAVEQDAQVATLDEVLAPRDFTCRATKRDFHRLPLAPAACGALASATPGVEAAYRDRETGGKRVPGRDGRNRAVERVVRQLRVDRVASTGRGRHDADRIAITLFCQPWGW
jgi:hypothetical protein